MTHDTDQWIPIFCTDCGAEVGRVRRDLPDEMRLRQVADIKARLKYCDHCQQALHRTQHPEGYAQ